jgi:hypothetical protein
MHTFFIKITRYHNLYFISYILPLRVSTRVICNNNFLIILT